MTTELPEGVQSRDVTTSRLTTRVLTPPFVNKDIVGAIDETWVREDGRWWFYQGF